MAKIDNGYMGGFTGRLGTAVGYQWRGKWCVRSYQPLARNPRTERQQAHRMMFKEEVLLASRMLCTLRQTLDDLSLQMHMTPSNYFIHRNQHAFVWQDGKLEVDWAGLVLSEGPVAPVQFDAPVVTEGTQLSIGFIPNPSHMRAGHFDHVFLYVFCPETGREFLTAPVYRRDRRLAVVLPEDFRGREVQLWGLVQDSLGRWSDSIYIGYGPLENTDTKEEVVGDSLPAEATDATLGAAAAPQAAAALRTDADVNTSPHRPPDSSPSC